MSSHGIKRIYQPNFLAYLDVDGPLFLDLKAVPNHSAWLYEALVQFYKQWEALPLGEDKYNFRTCLRAGHEDALIEFVRRLPTSRRRLVLRNAAWYQYGRLSGRGDLDLDVLAARIVANLRGVAMLRAPPERASDEVVEEVKAAMAQFIV